MSASTFTRLAARLASAATSFAARGTKPGNVTLISVASGGTTLVEVRMWPRGVSTVPVPVNDAPSAVVEEMPTVAASTRSATARVPGGAGSAAFAAAAPLTTTSQPAANPSAVVARCIKVALPKQLPDFALAS